MLFKLSRILFCALLLQSNFIIGTPSRSPRTLAKKVDSFLYKINTQVSSNTYTVKRLKGILHEVNKCKSPRDCIRILLSARKTYGADAQSNEYKKVWSALLVAVTKQLGTFAQHILINMLDELEQRITFWEEQQSKPIHYFLHKNPLHWLIGKRQGKEIKDNIKKLHIIQKEYLGHLGQLTMHLDAFNENANIQQQHAWVMHILKVVHVIVCHESKDKKLLQEKELNKNVSKVMMTILSALPKHKKNIEKIMYSTQPPNHFSRNWMLYTGLSAGMIWAYRNRNGKLNEWKNNLNDGMSRFYNNHLFGPWQDFKAMFGFGTISQRTAQDRQDDNDRVMARLEQRARELYQNYYTGSNITEEEFIAELHDGNTNTLDEIRVGLSHVISELPEELRTNFDAIITNLDDVLRDISRGMQQNNNNDGQENNINNNQNNNRSTFVQRRLLSDKDRQELYNLIDSIKTFRRELGSEDGFVRSILKNENVQSDDSNSSVLDKLISRNSQNRFKAFLNAYLLTADVYQIQLNRILAGQKLNLILLTAIPTVAVSIGGYFGLKALYRYFRPAYTFGPMKKALSEIARVLNWYEERPANKMSTIDYGTLLYFVHKLKLDAKHIVTESIRRRFLRDVKEIEFPQFTERQKIHVVTRMYREYDFLAA